MNAQTLGVVLSAAPGSASARAAMRISAAAADSGHRVTLFLSGDALSFALNTDSNKPAFKTFRALLAKGAEVIVCSVMARDRGLGKDALAPQVVQGSLLYFAELVQQCDRVVHFGAPA